MLEFADDLMFGPFRSGYDLQRQTRLAQCYYQNASRLGNNIASLICSMPDSVYTGSAFAALQVAQHYVPDNLHEALRWAEKASRMLCTNEQELHWQQNAEKAVKFLTRALQGQKGTLLLR